MRLVLHRHPINTYRMNRQNKCKGERDRGSKNYVSISNPKESKDSGVIYRLWKNGRDIDLQKHRHGGR